MTIAIIGSGAIGRALATRFAVRGIEVQLANSRGPESLAPLAAELGASIHPAALAEALKAEVVILAVPFDAVSSVVHDAAAWEGRVVVDATNAIDFPAFTPRDLGGRSSSSIIAEMVSGAQLVKAFNTLPAALLAEEPAQVGGRRVLFLSGDDAAANTLVSKLIERLGFAPITLGTLSGGGLLQQFGSALMVHNLIRQG
jgi:predicted dinucleotide-binding enzyme